MLIDWFTVAAQIINFLILVALLRYFLYGRIIAAMEKRQEQIDQRWQDADRAKQEAEQESDSMRKKNSELDAQRIDLLAKIQGDVEQQKHELLRQARAEVDQTRGRWSESLREETSSFLAELRRAASMEICSIARQAMADLADRELEAQVIRVFLHRLANVAADEPGNIFQRQGGGDSEAVVQSAFDIPSDQQEAIQKALRSYLAEGVQVRFERSPDLICGIALLTNSHRVAWEVSDYLDGLERLMRTTLEEATTDVSVAVA